MVITTSCSRSTSVMQFALPADRTLRPWLWRSRPCLREACASTSRMTNFAPTLSICSFTARAHVVGADHRAQTPRRGDRLQSGNARAEHEHLGRSEVPAAVISMGNIFGK